MRVDDAEGVRQDAAGEHGHHQRRPNSSISRDGIEQDIREDGTRSSAYVRSEDVERPVVD